jgi:hypothetical protein
MEFKTYTHEGSADALWGGLLGNFLSTTSKKCALPTDPEFMPMCQFLCRLCMSVTTD